MRSELIPISHIVRSIHFLRGQKVLLDFDLAELYGVTIKVLNQAVKRNADRFPKDFMFQITATEMKSLRSQFVTLKRGQHRKYLPYAFTEQGVAMLSSVLRSARAVKVNIAIMRAFVKLRATMESDRELRHKFAELERMVGRQGQDIETIIEAIRQLMAPPEKPKREIGFHVRETAPRYGTRKVR